MWTCSRCREEIDPEFDTCWNCGTDRAGRTNPGFRRADEVDPPTGAAPRPPDVPDPSPPPAARVAATCPACGEAGYRPTRPAGWVAYAPDRLCTGCGTRYTPPTPLWAAVVFLLLGTAMLLGAAVALVVYLLMGKVAGLPAAVVDVLFGLLGAAAVAHGARSLRGSGRP